MNELERICESCFRELRDRPFVIRNTLDVEIAAEVIREDIRRIWTWFEEWKWLQENRPMLITALGRLAERNQSLEQRVSELESTIERTRAWLRHVRDGTDELPNNEIGIRRTLKSRIELLEQRVDDLEDMPDPAILAEARPLPEDVDRVTDEPIPEQDLGDERDK